jgi:hypothetical protein
MAASRPGNVRFDCSKDVGGAVEPTIPTAKIAPEGGAGEPTIPNTKIAAESGAGDRALGAEWRTFRV